jgi:GR25 family glycosyltransferase involved in LPS biosynthesis
MSHINIIENAIKNKLDYCVILEDDVLFTDIENCNTHFQNILELKFDVFLLAGNVAKSAKIIVVDSNQDIFKISNVQTTAAYIVKSSYYEKLLSNFKEGYKNLLKKPKSYRKYAIDMYWKRLQKDDRWLIKLPLKITQKASYSDIEKCNVDYESECLTI